MSINLKKISIACLLASLSASTMAATYFFVQPKSGEMSKVSPLSAILNFRALPDAVVGQPYNGGIGFDLKPALQVSGDSEFNLALATFSITSGTLPVGLALSAAGVIAGTPTVASLGSTIKVKATYKTVSGERTYSMVSIVIPPATPGGYLVTSCLSIKTVNPASTSGIYALSRNVLGVVSNFDAYCDMTTDGGGWTLALYGNYATGSTSARLQDLVVQGYAMATRSESALYPAMPTGIYNNFAQFMHKGGTTLWTDTMGTWQRANTYSNATSVGATLSGVLTQNGRTSMYTGWGALQLATATLLLNDALGISPICGGDGAAMGKFCPYFSTDYATYPYHFDTASNRWMFVR